MATVRHRSKTFHRGTHTGQTTWPDEPTGPGGRPPTVSPTARANRMRPPAVPPTRGPFADPSLALGTETGGPETVAPTSDDELLADLRAAWTDAIRRRGGPGDPIDAPPDPTEPSVAFVRRILRRLSLDLASDAGDGCEYVLVADDEGTAARSEPLAIAAVYPWDQSLDGWATHDDGPDVPSVRLHESLRERPLRWGLLTNGRRWRLYADSTGHRCDPVYEADLPALLETGDRDAVATFTRLLGHEGFVGTGDDGPLLQRLADATAAPGSGPPAPLLDRVGEALAVLSDGFRRRPGVDPAAVDPAVLRDASLAVLYRLLLVGSVERSRRLVTGSLSPSASGEERGSDPSDTLHGLASDLLAEERQLESSGERRDQEVAPDAWGRFESLVGRFAPSRGGRSAAGPLRATGGWLFDTDPGPDAPPAASFLADHGVDDATLERVLAALVRTGTAADGRPIVAVPSCPGHRLGSIHETVGGWRLVVDRPASGESDGPAAATGAEGHGDATASTAADDESERIVAAAGDVVLRADDGERKATGSYYTPEPVVDHVVARTLGPLVDELEAERADAAEPPATDAAAVAEAVFGLDVLDPTMGCGRFLTSACEYLARRVVAAQRREAAARGLDSVDRGRGLAWARRGVAANCLYGVDLDPLAVELARATLRVRTFDAPEPAATLDVPEPMGTLDVPEPMGALDRHLRLGNGLVGAQLADVVDGDHLLQGDGGGEARSSTRTLATRLERLAAIADVHTARAFGHEVGPTDGVERLLAAIDDDRAWTSLAEASWVADARARADADRYLHWELAFPHVYRSGDASIFEADAADSRAEACAPDSAAEAAGSSAGTAGFDAVVGNPPWVATAGRTGVSARLDGELRAYLAGAFEATENQFDAYVAFCEQFVRQSADGRIGIVLPDSVLAREGTEPLRSFLLERTSLAELVRLGTAIPGVETGVAIVVTGGDGDEVRCVDAGERGLEALTPDTGGLTAGDDEVTRDADPTCRSAGASSVTSIPQSVFADRDASRFLLHLDEPTRSLLATIEGHPPLGDSVEIARGEEIGKTADVLHDEPSPGLRPIAPGSAIRRYGIDADELRYVDPADVAKPAAQYRAPQLLFRQTSDALVGTVDEEGLATIKSAYTLRVPSGSRELLRHLLGLLCSSVLDVYHRTTRADYRAVFPQINQSTFEALPVAIPDGPDPELVAAVERRLALTADRATVDPDLADALGSYDDGPTLADVAGCRPAPGVAETRLATTATDGSGPRIGSVSLTRRAGGLELAATVRYKPADDPTAGADGPAASAGAHAERATPPTDRWGYAETDPIPAVRFDPLDEGRTALLETFVPFAVENPDAVDGFRPVATATISPLDRLRELRLPRLADVRSGLRRYREARDRARALDAEIASVDRTIDDRVAALYGLSSDDRERVRRAVEDAPSRPTPGDNP